MPPSPDLRPTAAARPPAPARVPRFDVTERVVHWSTATLVLTLLATGAVLYVPVLSVAVGHRLGVEDAHVYVGLALFAPVVVGAIGRSGTQLRRDLAQVSWLDVREMAWLRSAGRRGREAVGKFNPGQKLNTSAIGGMLTVLLATGLVMRWGNFLPLYLRTGATFVHDVFAVTLVIVVAGHIAFALAHPRALVSMLAGWVPSDWPKHHAPAWHPSPAHAPAKPHAKLPNTKIPNKMEEKNADTQAP